MAIAGMNFGQNLEKQVGSIEKGVPEAKWALDGYKSSGKMIFMVRGHSLGLPLWSHLRS